MASWTFMPGEKLVLRFIEIDKLSTAAATGDGSAARPYRFGYGYADRNLNFRVDDGEKKVYFEFSDYSTSYVFYENLYRVAKSLIVTELFTFIPSEWRLGWEFRWRDVIDIACMTFFVYQAYIRFRGTPAARIGAGLAVLGMFYFLASQAGLFLTTWCWAVFGPRPLFWSSWCSRLKFVKFLSGSLLSS